MKKKCTNCLYYGKTALCSMYDHRQTIRNDSSIERAAKGYCNNYITKIKEFRRLSRG